MNFDKAYNKEEFLQFLGGDFLPNDFLKEDTRIEPQTKMTHTQIVTKLGVCKSLDLVVYEVKHKGKDDPRVGLSKEAFRLLADEWQDKALIVFVPEDNYANYRFSLITIDTIQGDGAKIKNIYSNPRRYSYYLGEGISYHTPNKYLNSSRVKDEKDLKERFSVEVLTKAFYNELSDWYAWAVKVVRFPNVLDDKTDDDKYNHEAVIRLVTRLIFVWFLKQKKLIPTEFFDEQYIAANLMDGFNPHANTTLFGKSDDSKYYKAILQNLFFAMLNSPITSTKGEMERRFMKDSFQGKNSDEDNKKLMRYKSMFSNPDHFVEIANRGVPFLNGGLFDCLDDRDNNNFVDGFSDKPKINKSLIVPDYLFFGEEVGKDIDLSEFYGDKKKKKVSARGVIDILKRYNFTVEENTPFDQEVSLDPELLGKVFENLLAMYNPETKATARKQTGSFYTPREIVQYMVDESLIAHLKRTVGDELEEEYRKLMCYTDEDTNLTDEQKRAVINSLHDCKILDPACGSGAFPMGVLQQMVHILSRLDESNEKWKEILLDDAAKETRTALKYSSKEERKEAMYDIERSFDESVNRPDYARKLYIIEKCIYGVDIQSIAIQISKLRFFISLVIDQIRNDNPKDNFGIRPLPNLEAKFVAANTLIGLDKSNGNLFETPEIKAKEEELKVANHKIFGAKTFKTKTKYREQVKELRSELSDMLLQMGYVSDDTAQLLNGWDMFDQNTSSPFFDPEWMFGINGGFDVVIGNPPYVSAVSMARNEEEKKLYKKLYPEAKGAYDLYTLFLLRGSQLSNNISCWIIPNKFLIADYAADIRTKLQTNGYYNTIDISIFDVFESASVYPIIILGGKSSAKLRKQYKINTIEDLKNNYIYEIEKIDTYATLKDFGIEVCSGTTGFEAQKIKPYIKDCVSNSSLIPFTVSGNIDRYTWNNHNVRYMKSKYENCYISKDTDVAESKMSLWMGDKIIVAGMTKVIEATLIRHPLAIGVGVYAIKIAPKYDPRYILALLNSKFTSYYLQIKFKDKHLAGGYLAINKTTIEQLPFALMNDPETIISLVDKILEVKRENPTADTTVLETQIDVMVYKLYNLTYDEVLIIDPNTPITKEEYESK